MQIWSAIGAAIFGIVVMLWGSYPSIHMGTWTLGTRSGSQETEAALYRPGRIDLGF